MFYGEEKLKFSSLFFPYIFLDLRYLKNLIYRNLYGERGILEVPVAGPLDMDQ